MPLESNISQQITLDHHHHHNIHNEDISADISEDDDDYYMAQSFSESDTESENEADDIQNDLASWAVNYRITHVALAALLPILKKFVPSLPKDPRVLLNTDMCTSVIQVAGGVYHHIGMKV